MVEVTDGELRWHVEECLLAVSDFPPYPGSPKHFENSYWNIVYLILVAETLMSNS